MYECRCIFYDLLYGTLNISCRGWDFESKMEFRSKVSNMAFFVIVAAAILTSIGVSSVSSVSSVFADKCDNNGDNNCNTAEVDQKALTDNKCKLENLSKDHSNENFDDNLLSCINSATNLKDFATIPDQFSAIS